jgi:hypothetical protein
MTLTGLATGRLPGKGVMATNGLAIGLAATTPARSGRAEYLTSAAATRLAPAEGVATPSIRRLAPFADN